MVSQVARFLTLAGHWGEGLDSPAGDRGPRGRRPASGSATRSTPAAWRAATSATRSRSATWSGASHSRRPRAEVRAGATRLHQPRLDPRRQGRRPGQGRRRDPRGPRARRAPGLAPVDPLVPRQSRGLLIPARELGGGATPRRGGAGRPRAPLHSIAVSGGCVATCAWPAGTSRVHSRTPRSG